MKKISVWLTICTSIALIIILSSATPGETKSSSYKLTADQEETTGGHTGLCLDCHFTDDLHSEPEHGGPNDCNNCHEGDPGKGNVLATACIQCHPTDNPGQCSLANSHAYEACLKCHYECLEDNVTTTTITVSRHFSICTQCHLSDDLHVNEGHHDTCLDCHEGESEAGNVSAGTCAACHPESNPGKCSLTELHNKASCGNCHGECAEDNSTTTVLPMLMHGGECAKCHTYADIHSLQGHLNCAACHKGPPQAGNVEADSCISNNCHPAGNPGKCNLVETDEHSNSTCLNCHFDCADNGSSSPDSPEFSVHINLCLECHYENDLHDNTNHSVCTLCHDISAVVDDEAGPVTASTCTACHPAENPGFCAVGKAHGPITCQKCHFECIKGSDNTSTTTTAQTPVTTTTTIVDAHPTTTTVSPDCPSEVVLGNKHEDLDTLRVLRDNILSKSRQGRTCTSLYYRYAPEVSLMILSDKDLRTEAETAIRSIIPDIKLIIDSKKVDTLHPRTCAKLKNLLEKISLKASPGLKYAIKQFRDDLKDME